MITLDFLGTTSFAEHSDWSMIGTRRQAIVDRFRSIDLSHRGVIAPGAEGPFINLNMKPTTTGVSDTISFVVSTGDDPSHVLPVIAPDLGRAFVFSIMQGELLRGALAYGRYSLTKDLATGPAVNEAGAYFNRHKWAGVAGAPSVAAFLERMVALPFWYFPWRVPTRSGNERVWGLAWPPYWRHERHGQDELRSRLVELFDRRLADEAERPEVEAKKVTTLEFFDACNLAADEKVRQDAELTHHQRAPN